MELSTESKFDIFYNLRYNDDGKEAKIMCKALDVANFFIDLANADPDECMTNLRVNKLLYFAQGWSLVQLKKPLFKDDIQAWKYGPVVPEVYEAYKEYGRERISQTKGDYTPDCFTSDELNLLCDVIDEYGKYSSTGLVELTHVEGSPWEKVYIPNANMLISNESLKKFFSKLPPLKHFSVTDDENIIGYRDEKTGNYVLPKEWDDDE